MKEKINGTDTIWGDIINILIPSEVSMENIEEPVHKGTMLTIYTNNGHNITFDDITKIALENGFTTGVFTMIAEKPLEGKVYQYANCYECEPYWYEHGKTRGYA